MNADLEEFFSNVERARKEVAASSILRGGISSRIKNPLEINLPML